MTAPIVQSRHPDLDALAARFAQQGEQVQSLTRQVTQRAEVLRAGGWEGRGKAAFLAEVDGEVTPALLRLSVALAQAGQVTAQIRLLILAAEEDAAAPFRGDDSRTETPQPSTAESGEYINTTNPSDASRSPVTDTRPPLQQWLGDNTPFAFIPGFTPPVGGDIETIDDRLDKKFGRNVNLVDGNEKWTEYEAAAVDRAVASLPPTLAKDSLVRNIYRDRSQSDSPLAFWLPPNYQGSQYGAHEPQSITFIAPMPFKSTRQGSPEPGSRVETVIFHELVHSSQYTADGQPSDLAQRYFDRFGWTHDSSGKWHYDSSKGLFPGTTDSFLIFSVAYPEAGRNGKEDMADAITYYRYEPETLRRESPERYTWIKENVFGGQEF